MPVFRKNKDKKESDAKKEKTRKGSGGIEENGRARKGDISKLKDESKSSLEGVILSPRITEKATEEAEGNVYVFNVAKHANKSQIFSAIEYLHGVSPRKVNVVNRQPRETTRFGRKGKKKGFKKAYVYLKEGQEIEVM